jgi:hypothetical protein
MLKDYSKLSCCVVDSGVNIELAIKLAESFGTVWYYSEWEEAYPKSNKLLVGEGIKQIKRQNDLFEFGNDGKCFIDKPDLWIFPDLYHSGFQLYLDSLGKRVWGSRTGEELELYRDESKKHYKKLGLPVGKYVVIIGFDKLKEYLKEHENVFVKTSVSRGDFESFSSRNYEYIEPYLCELEHTLGPKKDIAEFIVEDAIDDAVEIGYDGYCIDGEFPKKACCGLEIKDHGYVGKFQDYADMPKEITEFTKEISETMKKYKYRNFMSTDNRITKDHTSYMNDICARQPHPPSEITMNMFENLPDIIWFGAEGKCVTPICSKPWGAEVMIESATACTCAVTLQFPDKIRDNVKLRNFTVINGEYYVIPQTNGETCLGAVVATGNTMEEAIENVKKIAKQVTGFKIKIHTEALDDAQNELDILKSYGIEI